MTIGVGVLVIVTSGLLALTVWAMYPPASGITVAGSLERALPWVAGGGGLVVVLGVVVHFTSRHR